VRVDVDHSIADRLIGHAHAIPHAHPWQVGEGPAAGQSLRRECALLQRIDSAGVERCLGLGTVAAGAGGGKRERTIEVLRPYLVNDEQLDRWVGVRGMGEG
jgi:hypothetical protein